MCQPSAVARKLETQTCNRVLKTARDGEQDLRRLKLENLRTREVK